MKRAKHVKLDINHGINDRFGENGSVLFTHSLRAFNEIAEEKDRLTETQINNFFETRKLPDDLKTETLTSEDHNSYNYSRREITTMAMSNKMRPTPSPIFRRTSGNTQVTIFEGAHEVLHETALYWLSQQEKKPPEGEGSYRILFANDETSESVVWFLNKKYEIDTSKGDVLVPGFAKYNANITGWVPVSYHAINNGSSKMIWINDNTKELSIWYLNEENAIDKNNMQGGFRSIKIEKKYVIGWSIVGCHVLGDQFKILWKHDTSEKASLWTYDQSNWKKDPKMHNYAGRQGYKVANFHFNSDGSIEMIWNRLDTGKIELWHLDELGFKKSATSFKHGNAAKTWRVVDITGGGKTLNSKFHQNVTPVVNGKSMKTLKKRKKTK